MEAAEKKYLPQSDSGPEQEEIKKLPEQEESAEVIPLKDFMEKPSVREILARYASVINAREEQYTKDILADPTKEFMRSNLDTHNEIVISYALDLIHEEGLNSEEKVAAYLATILHDGGKLASGLLDHHEKGVEYADKILKEMKGKDIDGVEITDEIIGKIKEAIERHMNHPFLVMLKGEKFPVPQDKVDAVVFDADMLANIGFKNVAIRIGNEKMLSEDALKAQEKGICTLQESFENVLGGARQLENIVLSDAAKEMSKSVIGNVNMIYDYLVKNGRLEKLQKMFSDPDGNFDPASINAHGGPELLKRNLNEEIAGARMALVQDDILIDQDIVDKIMM